MRGPSRAQIYRRRLVALILLAVVVGAGAFAAWAALRDRHSAAPPPTTTAPPRILKVLFPEGFTRREMAARAAADSPAITAADYLRATTDAVHPGSGAGPPAR